MAEDVADILTDILNSTASGSPAAARLKLQAALTKSITTDLATHETGALAASAGLAAGSLFLNTAGALMKVL